MDTEKANKMIIYDLVFGLILICISILFCYKSLVMARPKGWPTAPGLSPLIIHASLGLMGFILFRGGIKKQGLKLIKEKLKQLSISTTLKESLLFNKTFFLTAIFFVYYLFFTRILPFELSTSIYLFVIFKIFWKRSVVITLISSVFITIAFSLVFSNIFKVMLPGIEWRELWLFLKGMN